MIIGIVGKKQAGKDTVGKIIQYLTGINSNIPYDEWLDSEYDNDFNSDWKVKKFAHAVKVCVGTILGEEDFVERWEANIDDYRDKPLGKEWNLIIVYNNDAAKEIMTRRKLLQYFGTNAGREVHPNIWINALFSEYVPDYIDKFYDDRGIYDVSEQDEIEHPRTYPNWIITDCRFLNEAEAIKERGGILIRKEPFKWIDKREWDLESKGKTDTHPSEVEQDEIEVDYTIYWRGDKEDLIERVREILENEKLL